VQLEPNRDDERLHIPDRFDGSRELHPRKGLGGNTSSTISIGNPFKVGSPYIQIFRLSDGQCPEDRFSCGSPRHCLESRRLQARYVSKVYSTHSQPDLDRHRPVENAIPDSWIRPPSRPEAARSADRRRGDAKTAHAAIEPGISDAAIGPKPWRIDVGRRASRQRGAGSRVRRPGRDCGAEKSDATMRGDDVFHRSGERNWPRKGITAPTVSRVTLESRS
jgi:hypothetical protein